MIIFTGDVMDGGIMRSDAIIKIRPESHQTVVSGYNGETEQGVNNSTQAIQQTTINNLMENEGSEMLGRGHLE